MQHLIQTLASGWAKCLTGVVSGRDQHTLVDVLR